ncbi:MAG TPA: hypothetical protein VEA63_03685, partial [Opitutus sp.]|nr:hypothetical protein [Opitutus sp.]
RGVESEIWVYARTIEGKPRPMTTGTRDVPYVDPLTGAARTIKEPVYGYEQTTITEETELLMLDGALVQWKQQAFSERDYR